MAAGISPREHEIAELLAEGYNGPEIAARLGIAPRTVKQHCDTLRWKLGVPERRFIGPAYRRLHASWQSTSS